MRRMRGRSWVPTPTRLFAYSPSRPFATNARWGSVNSRGQRSEVGGQRVAAECECCPMILPAVRATHQRAVGRRPEAWG